MEVSRAHQTPVESAHWPCGLYRIRQERALASQRAVVKGEVRGEGRLPKKSDVGTIVNGLNQPSRGCVSNGLSGKLPRSHICARGSELA